MAPRLSAGVPASAPWSRMAVRWMQDGRVPAKHGNKQYYKGTGGGSMGHFERGEYVIDAHKVRNYIIPSLEAFPLRAYVAKTSHPAQSASAVKTVKQYIEQAE